MICNDQMSAGWYGEADRTHEYTSSFRSGLSCRPSAVKLQNLRYPSETSIWVQTSRAPELMSMHVATPLHEGKPGRYYHEVCLPVDMPLEGRLSGVWVCASRGPRTSRCIIAPLKVNWDVRLDESTPGANFKPSSRRGDRNCIA